MHPAPQSESRLMLAAIDWPALAARYGWRLVVLFGSTAGGAEGRDIDLAVLPVELPDLLEHGRWQAVLEGLLAPRPVDLLLLGPATSPVTRFEVFRAGRCLYEGEAGLFERERDRAFFLYADSEWLRRQQGEVLRGKSG
ncbi:nucleotidyltransferase domain-containing protein [uncultured Thiohalocapsa sp.]|uniref:nucleotidyltransferase domain-containing protein n=1 Tax=uncultured Thiohalocapsa sp. TaxID=768990 RepID=UPI00345C8D53